MTLASQTRAKYLKRHFFIKAFTKWSQDYTAYTIWIKELDA